MKTIAPFTLNILLIGILFLQNSFAQDSIQWNLPEDAKARIGKGRIGVIQYSHDGTILGVASDIGIWLYDATTLQEIALLTEHTSAVSRIAFSPNGGTLASGDRNGTMILWDRSTGAKKILWGIQIGTQILHSVRMEQHLRVEVEILFDFGIQTRVNLKMCLLDSRIISDMFHTVRMATQL